MNLNNLMPDNWHSYSIPEVLNLLNCSSSGLSTEEAKKRFEKYGRNQILKKNVDTPIKLLCRQINNPLIWVLLGSSLIAIILGKITDGLIVLSVVIINSIIGFIQEYKAGKAIESLNEMVPDFTTVIRDGNKLMIHSLEIVPGDIVHLSAGDRIPADMRIICFKNLHVDEAVLTGESLPTPKHKEIVDVNSQVGDRKCMIFSGTLVTSGTVTAVVVGTGMNTELGNISQMLTMTTSLETPLTKKLATVGNYLTIGIIAITFVIMIVGALRIIGQGVHIGIAIKEGLIFAIALAVGAIPEGLPAVVTIALAIGVRRMAKRNAIIRKLPAVETLGSTSIICSDKTGTLTKNQMTVCELWTPYNRASISGVGYNISGDFFNGGQKINNIDDNIIWLLKSAALCSDASIKIEQKDNVITTGDPTEIALIVAAAKANIDTNLLNHTYPRLDVIPFDSELQYMATLNMIKDFTIILKGAPEVVLNKCHTHLNNSNIDKSQIVNVIEGIGNCGMRVLAIAQKKATNQQTRTLSTPDIQDGFELLGLIGMIDPSRPEAIESIRICQKAGITVKMITGDHYSTAKAIGIELGLAANGEVVCGSEIAKMDDLALRSIVDRVNIFARVAPEHKLRLVKAIQSNGHVVAMTGDGVNDAPSLKQANIGVAMGITGSSVSKESSDIVLADDNFQSISAAVEEGRRVYDNLLKSLAFLLPTNIGLALILVYGIIFFPFDSVTKELLLPMLPAQLLWINLVASVTLALPLAFEVKEPDIMTRPPRNPAESLFNLLTTFRMFFVSILMTIGTIIIFNIEYSNTTNSGFSQIIALAKAQTIAVTFVIIFQIFYMLNCRSLKDSIIKIGLFSNYKVFIGIVSIIIFHAIFIYSPTMNSIFGTIPLNWSDLILPLLLGCSIFPIIGLEKWIEKKFLINKFN